MCGFLRPTRNLLTITELLIWVILHSPSFVPGVETSPLSRLADLLQTQPHVKPIRIITVQVILCVAMEWFGSTKRLAITKIIPSGKSSQYAMASASVVVEYVDFLFLRLMSVSV